MLGLWILVDVTRRAEEQLGEQRLNLEGHKKLKCSDSCTPVARLSEVGSVWLNSVSRGPRETKKNVGITERRWPPEVVASPWIRAYARRARARSF